MLLALFYTKEELGLRVCTMISRTKFFKMSPDPHRSDGVLVRICCGCRGVWRAYCVRYPTRQQYLRCPLAASLYCRGVTIASPNFAYI